MEENKKEDKKRMQLLIDDFKANYQEYKKLNESNVETKLVEEVFIDILGWTKKDFEKQARAHRGEKRGKADYAFYIGDKIVFFLEVKRVGVPLEKEADKQVISYALSKRVPFAISTNFEELKIFCVEEKDAINNKFRVITSPDDYINNFDDLLFLSKESFEQGLTLKKAENEGRLKKRVSIDKILLDDLMHIRSLVVNDIEKSYPHRYNINEKDEIIQRIIDRLIFIRRCEDTNINPDNTHLDEIQYFPDDNAYPKLKDIFKTYNEIYNGGLFAIAKDNDCDTININGGIIKNLVGYLYESKDKNYVYNFDWIDADVLGQVYEQYLGKILAQTKSGDAKLKEGQAHRKEQGIYYTPTYIVDYIVKNTVEKILKNKKVKVKNIKILDPACGSGSFLIKAFDYLYKDLSSLEESKQRKIDSQGIYSVKTEILKNNIYGVDLDNKAVEITKLNLLLKAAEKNRKLPEELDLHIRHGNSLIDDESVVGFDDAFKWIGDFQEGSFDVVIGNPPYVFTRETDFGELAKEYFKTHYSDMIKLEFKSKAKQSGKLNLFVLFLIKSIDVLREKGILGFIIPNTFLRVNTYIKLRKFILDNCKVLKITDMGVGVFEGVTASTIIIILQKEPSEKYRNKNKIEILKLNQQKQDKDIHKISQSNFYNNENYVFNIISNRSYNVVLDKIEKDSLSLGEIGRSFNGIATKKDKNKYISNYPQDSKYKPLLEGKDIKKYRIEFKNKYILYDRKVLHRPRDEKIFLSNEKIITQRIGGGSRVIVATLDTEQYYTFNSTNNILLHNKNFSSKYILSLLNSKLLNWYYVMKFTNLSNLTVNISKTNLEQLPIKDISLKEQKPIVKLVDNIIHLNKRFNEFSGKKTAQSVKLEEEIKRIDDEINEFVYKIYEITKKEREIIKDSLKQTKN